MDIVDLYNYKMTSQLSPEEMLGDTAVRTPTPLPIQPIRRPDLNNSNSASATQPAILGEVIDLTTGHDSDDEEDWDADASQSRITSFRRVLRD